MERYGTKRFGFVAICVALEKLRNVSEPGSSLQRCQTSIRQISLKNDCFIVHPTFHPVFIL